MKCIYDCLKECKKKKCSCCTYSKFLDQFKLKPLCQSKKNDKRGEQ